MISVEIEAGWREVKVQLPVQPASSETTEKVYEFSIARSPALVKITESDLRGLISRARDRVDVLRKHNDAVVDSIKQGTVNKNMYIWTDYGGGIRRGDIKRGYSSLSKQPAMRDNGTYTYVGSKHAHVENWQPIGQDQIDTAYDVLDYITSKIDEFDERFKKGRLKKGIYLPLYTAFESKYSNGGSSVDEYFVSVAIPDVVQCTVCGDTIVDKNIAAHQKRITCKDAGVRNDLEARGLCLVPRRTKLFRAAVKGLIPNELVAIEYDAFVPKWVLDAEKIWERNSEQYAGLKFEDFINRMAPNEEGPGDSSKL